MSITRIPRMRLKISSSSSVKLVVLIPPPVEPGEAPINIRIITTSRVELVNAPISTVLKPAVRGTTAWKKEARMEVFKFIPFKTLFISIK